MKAISSLRRSFYAVLKRLSVAQTINASLKCFLAKRRYHRTCAYYQKAVVAEHTANYHANRTVRAAARSSERPRVFFMGTDEQQDKSGFVQALERACHLRCFTRADGTWGQNAPLPHGERRASNSADLERHFEQNAAEGWVPELLLTQTWGSLIDPAALKRITARYSTLIANVAMDDRHQYWGTKRKNGWDGTYALIGAVDLHLTAAPEAVSWYEKEGDRALIVPEASDPYVFHPMPKQPKVHDVSFVGGRYGVREKIVNTLRAKGISVSAHGSGWENGRLPNDLVPTLFAQSKIVLGVGTIGHCDDFFALKLRDFDAPMSGSCYLTSHNEDLARLFKIGEEMCTYHSVQDCAQVCQVLLADDNTREKIAASGRARAIADHTWDTRFTSLFAALAG